MTAASIAQKVISFAYFTLIARSIGVTGTGKYFFALSFTTVFVVFVDLGFTNVLIREVAKGKERAQGLLSLVFGSKIILGSLAYLAVVVAINLLDYPIETRHLVYLSGVTMLFDSLHLTLYGVLRAFGDLKYEALSIPASQLCSMILGSFFLFFHLPLVFLILAFTIPSMLNAGFAAIIVIRRYHLRLLPAYDWGNILSFARLAFPFALSAIFARLYSYADTILLSKMAGDAAVGWYSIPYKITFAFQFIPLALTAALYPRLSEYFVDDKKRLTDTFVQSITYLLVVAVPIAFGISVLARPIILTLYKEEFLPSVVPLMILIMSLLFSFISFPIGAMLNACNRQKTQTAIVGITLAVNIILNLILIPRYGATGAAIAAGVGNMLLALVGYSRIPAVTPLPHGRIVSIIARLILSGATMSAVVWYVSVRVHFGFAILAGAVTYMAMLVLVRIVNRKELQSTYEKSFARHA